MYSVLIAIGILVGGAVVSRFIQGAQTRRMEAGAREQLYQNTRRIRAYGIVPILVLIVLFVVGAVVLPESFGQLARISLIGAGVYTVIMNAVIFVHYARVRCGFFFFFWAIVARIIVVGSILGFGYVIIRAL